MEGSHAQQGDDATASQAPRGGVTSTRESLNVPANRWAAREAVCGAVLDRITELQQQVCALQAEQLRQVAEFVGHRNALDADLGVFSSPAQYRCLLAEAALATNFSITSTSAFVSDAYALATWHPHTLALLAAGTINLPAARAVAQSTRLLGGADQQALADQVIAEELPDVPPAKIRNLVERRVMEIDPDAAARQSERARADKHVSCTPTGIPGTAWFNAYLPAEQAAACWRALDDRARCLKAESDPRSLSHLMCDPLVERVTGARSLRDVTVHLNLVMSDTTLLGLDDRPADLGRTGALPADIARHIAVTGNTWVKRLYVDPVDGCLTNADSRRRRFDGPLRDFIRARDSHCRGIKCASPIRDLDHVLEHSRGGRTTAENGQGLSKNCHTSRDHPAMRVRYDSDTRTVVWTTPSNRVYRSLPPPALGPGAANASRRQYRRWILHPPPSDFERRLLTCLIKHHRRPRAD